MKQGTTDERFDSLAAQLHEWTESAVALDEGHFPNELLNDLEDVITELKDFLEDSDEYERQDVIEIFVTPEMAEVVNRFAKVRRMLERAWGPKLTELLEEEAEGFGTLDDGDDDD